MRSRRPNKYLVGPLLGPIPHEGRLKFLVPAPLIDRIGEPALRAGFSTSRDSIIRAYKARPADEVSPDELDWECLYWLLVETRAHDYVKHFKGSLRRGAFRVPRLLARICPKCGEPLFGRFCGSCGELVGEPRYIEVWRDKSAAQALLGPFRAIQEGPEVMKFVGEGLEYSLPKLISRELILSARPCREGFYLHILRVEGGARSGRGQPLEQGDR
ncbi:MAG: zinc ribbon domain-containing protein [Nitrososphaerota archaeon]